MMAFPVSSRYQDPAFKNQSSQWSNVIDSLPFGTSNGRVDLGEAGLDVSQISAFTPLPFLYRLPGLLQLLRSDFKRGFASDILKPHSNRTF